MTNFLDGQTRAINKLKDKKFHTTAAEIIVKSQKLEGFIIHGAQRSGKSVYGTMILYELYDHDVDEMFRHMFFSMKDLNKFLIEAAKTDERCPAIMVDDAGVHMSANSYNTNRRQAVYLSAVMDTIGIICKGLIFTTPNPNNLLKAIRNYEFYRVQISMGRHTNDRIAKAYSHTTSPDGTHFWINTEYEDKFYVKVPYYERYAEIRKQMSISTLKDMETFLNNEPKRNPIIEMDGKRYVEMDITE